MSDSNFESEYISEEFRVGCTELEGDALISFRIGPEADAASLVGVEIATQELSFDGDREAGEFVRATVVLTPADARRFAASLIDWADDCEGQTAPMLAWSVGDDDGEE